MEIFKIKKENEGEVFIIRPLLNVKNIRENITSYKIGFSDYGWIYRYMCLALVNDELRIFDFPKEICELLFIDNIPELLHMSSNKAIKISVGVRGGFLDNKYEIIEDDKFRFDSTKENREFIENILTTTELDLEEATELEKLKIADNYDR